MFSIGRRIGLVLVVLALDSAMARAIDDHAIQKLLTSMTIKDKIGQMSQIDIPQLCEDDPTEPGKKRLSLSKVRTVIGEHGVGSVLNKFLGTPLTPQEYRQAAILIQEVAKNYSRPPVI